MTPDQFKAMQDANGESFTNGFVSTIVHEGYHVNEANNLYLMGRQMSAPPNPLTGQDEGFKRAIFGYSAAVFDLMKNMDQATIAARIKNDPQIKQRLELIAGIIARLRGAYSEAFSKYIYSEYTEGFAEYAAAQTMVDAGLRKFEFQVKTEIDDSANCIFYRTGALGGMFMHATVKSLPWSGNISKDLDSPGVWERLNSTLGISPATKGIVDSYLAGLSDADINEQVKLMAGYFGH